MKKNNFFWGLLFILAAVLILLNQFGFFAPIGMFEIVVTVLLVGIMVKSIFCLNFWGILFPLAFICIIHAETLNLKEFTPWPALLTAFLISLGLSLIFKRERFFVFHHHHHHRDDDMFSKRIINEKDDSRVECSISFGESMKYVNTDNFESAHIRCSFGEIKVFFDNAQIPSGKADIYLDVSFGDAQLYIPKSWHVISKVNVFLGDMSEKNYNLGNDSPVVTIHGNISFGDAKIIYV